MSIIAWLIVGGVAGWIASLIMKTDAQQGIFMNIIVGVLGALIGGYLFNLLGYTGVDGFNFYSFLVAVVGSVVLLWIYKFMRRA